MTKAPTKREQLLRVYGILTDLGNVELAEFIAREVALLDKRRNAPKALTATQRENIAFKQEIVRVLNATAEARATAIANEVGISVQKASALLRQLTQAGVVERVEKGKETVFRINEGRFEE
jgi:predicted transcriptional regulator